MKREFSSPSSPRVKIFSLQGGISVLGGLEASGKRLYESGRVLGFEASLKIHRDEFLLVE